jgi:hypothetical protein
MNFTSKNWASITFTGARHEVTFLIGGETARVAADRFLDGLACADFSLRGHILADLALVDRQDREDGVLVSIEALTVEDG